MLRLIPWIDRAFFKRQGGVRNHEVQIVIDGVAEPLTARARAGRVVEAEQAGLGNSKLHSAGFACEFFAVSKPLPFPARLLKNNFSRFAITDLDRVDDPLMHVPAQCQSVDQNPYRLVEIDLQ